MSNIELFHFAIEYYSIMSYDLIYFRMNYITRTAMTKTFAKTTKIVQKPSDFGSFLWHWQVFMKVAFI